MNPLNITLVTFGFFEKSMLEKISAALVTEFSATITLRDAHLDISELFDPGRRQYNGDKLLQLVDSMELSGSDKRVGIFSVDLFIPILTYIFGQAQLGGRSAIASHYRLGNERYGMPPDDTQLTSRFLKEVNHELGHTLGLLHCHEPACVMRSSTYVEDIDLKEAHLCIHCRDKMATAAR